MLDFRLREVKFQLDGVWYSVIFRTVPLGRVRDVEVYCSTSESGAYSLSKAKVSPQNTTALQALQMFWGEFMFDVNQLLRKIRKQNSA